MSDDKPDDQKVRWTRCGDGWGAPGIGRVVQVDTNRMHFGPKMGTPGPALLLRLDHNGLTQWVSPNEIESV